VLAKPLKSLQKARLGGLLFPWPWARFLGLQQQGFLGQVAPQPLPQISGAVGGFGSSLLAGDGLKTALRNGLTGAVLAGGTAAITGGSAALQQRPSNPWRGV
jgi:hypothetical protein